MYQKDLVKQAWGDAGLYRTRDPELRAFLDRLDSCGDCWPELVEEVRRHYRPYLEVLARPLWRTGDRLVRLNLVRSADLEDQQERALVEEFVREAGTGDVHELQAIARNGDLPLVDLIARKRKLPPTLREYVLGRRAELVREAVPGRDGA